MKATQKCSFHWFFLFLKRRTQLLTVTAEIVKNDTGTLIKDDTSHFELRNPVSDPILFKCWIRILHFKNEGGSAILHTTSVEWHDINTEQPSSTDQPMKTKICYFPIFTSMNSKTMFTADIFLTCSFFIIKIFYIIHKLISHALFILFKYTTKKLTLEGIKTKRGRFLPIKI